MKTEFLLFGLAGVGLVGFGVAVTRQKVGREEVTTKVNKGGYDPNVPTLTTNPEAEREKATLGQSLAALKSDRRNWQSRQDTASARMRDLEASVSQACNSYAQSPIWKYFSEGFMGQSNRSDIVGSEQDNQAFNNCRNFAKGIGSIPRTRDLPFQNSFNLSSSWRDAGAEAKYNNMQAEIGTGYDQAADIRSKYESYKREYDAATAQLAEIDKKISDLNARGVY